MKYINQLALMALAVLGFGLQASEQPINEADTAAMGEPTESAGWSLPAKVAGATGLGALGAGAAYATNEWLKLRSAEQAVESAKDILNKIANKDLPKSGYRAAMQKLRDAHANLDHIKAETYGMPNVGGYLSNAKNAIGNWWSGPQQTSNYYPSLDPELGGGAYGLFGAEQAANAVAPAMGTNEYGFIPAELGGGVYGLAPQPATSWYSPIINAPSAISSRWGALDPYSKVGAALAGAALAGGLGYGLYRRYRTGDMPAVEAALTGTMTNEQVAQIAQKQEVIGILATMLDLVRGEGSGMKVNGNVGRLNQLQSYVESLNAVGVATTELASVIQNIKDEFAAIKKTDFSVAGKYRSKIAKMYESLQNILNDMIRNASQ